MANLQDQANQAGRPIRDPQSGQVYKPGVNPAQPPVQATSQTDKNTLGPNAARTPAELSAIQGAKPTTSTWNPDTKSYDTQVNNKQAPLQSSMFTAKDGTKWPTQADVNSYEQGGMQGGKQQSQQQPNQQTSQSQSPQQTPPTQQAGQVQPPMSPTNPNVGGGQQFSTNDIQGGIPDFNKPAPAQQPAQPSQPQQQTTQTPPAQQTTPNTQQGAPSSDQQVRAGDNTSYSDFHNSISFDPSQIGSGTLLGSTGTSGADQVLQELKNTTSLGIAFEQKSFTDLQDNLKMQAALSSKSYDEAIARSESEKEQAFNFNFQQEALATKKNELDAAVSKASYDTQLAVANDNNSRLEGFMKAKLEQAGMLDSSEGLTLIGKYMGSSQIALNQLEQNSQNAQQYYALQSQQIMLDYGKQALQIGSQYNQNISSLLTGKTQAIMDIQKDLTTSEAAKNKNIISLLKDYQDKSIAYEQNKKKDEIELYKVALDKQKFEYTTTQDAVKNQQWALDFKQKQWQYENPSGYQQAQLGLDRAKIGLDAQRVAIESGRLQLDTAKVQKEIQQGNWTQTYDAQGNPMLLDSKTGNVVPYPTLGDTTNIKTGSYGGECGAFVNKQLGTPHLFGDSYESKMSVVNSKIPVPGAAFVMPIKGNAYGHTGLVESVNPDGSVNVVDSNWHNNGVVSRHTIAANQITGYYVPKGIQGSQTPDQSGQQPQQNDPFSFLRNAGQAVGKALSPFENMFNMAQGKPYQQSQQDQQPGQPQERTVAGVKIPEPGVDVNSKIQSLPPTIRTYVQDQILGRQGLKPPPALNMAIQNAVNDIRQSTADSKTPTYDTLDSNGRELAALIADNNFSAVATRARKTDLTNFYMAAKEINPDFNQNEFERNKNTYDQFYSNKPGTVGAANNSFNTALQHMGELNKEFNNLNNTDFPDANNVQNWMSQHSGSPFVGAYNTIKDFLSGELVKAAGSSISESEAARANALLDTNQSPAQFKESMKELSRLMAGKMKSGIYQYQQQLGRDPDYTILSPDAQNTLKEFGQDPSEFDPTIKKSGNFGSVTLRDKNTGQTYNYTGDTSGMPSNYEIVNQ